jgi:PhoPQ-activated pathogenicity-related protein
MMEALRPRPSSAPGRGGLRPGAIARARLVLAAGALLAAGCAGGGRLGDTALGRYVARPDPSARWALARTIPGPGWTAYVIDLTSQTWRTAAEVDRSVWKHWLTVIKPDAVKTGTALLFLDGGDNGKETPSNADARLAAIAVANGAVVAEVGQLPNQPLNFSDGGRPRWEDDLIFHTWKKCMETGDETWPARLPMVKGAVRAMDAVQAFLKAREGGAVTVGRFVVAGGSKRGGTALLAGAVDDRVAAVVSLVVDGLNLQLSLEHHHAAYGSWSPALGDYERNGITEMRGAPGYARLLQIEDPFSYRDALTFPKLIINASGDEFFPPDSSRFYFGDLPGEKLLRYVPNAKHSLAGSDAMQSLEAFFRLVAEGRPRPVIRWELSEDGSLIVHAGQDEGSAPRPAEASLWQATNPAARDFRLDVIGKAWTRSPVAEAPGSGGVYSARVPPPARGWTAFFMEIEYPTGGPNPLKLTTQVHITPDTLPHPGE